MNVNVCKEKSPFRCRDIHLIKGPVRSGKSTLLERKIEVLGYTNRKVLAVHPSVDSANAANAVTLHSGKTRNSLAITGLTELKMYLENGYCNSAFSNSSKFHTCAMTVGHANPDEWHIPFNVLCIDEGQFFPELAEMCRLAAEEFGVDVYVAALSSDWRRAAWPAVSELEPLCTKVTTCCAVCHVCQSKKACFSNYTNAAAKPDTRFDPGSKYFPMCRKCYLEWSATITAPI